jgi:DNA processing protein
MEAATPGKPKHGARPEDLVRHGIVAVPIDDPRYPPLLRHIPDPPRILYVRGDAAALAEDRTVAVVGARKMTPYGAIAAATLSAGLARRGLTVVSGLALGIDAAAHRAALDAEGTTVAVLAGGTDRASVGPRANAGLADRIASSGGAIVSEHPPGAVSYSGNFPLRNRIIAGMSRGVIVVEAASRSGSLITARLAATYGRDVLAVPGPITAPASAGTNELLFTGAAPALDPDRIAEFLGIAPAPPEGPVRRPASGPDASVLAALGGGARTTDEIIDSTGLGAAEAAAAIARLELAGTIVRRGDAVSTIDTLDASRIR